MTPMDQQPQAEEPQAPAGYCIEIHVAADGKCTVAVEPEAQEGSEEGQQEQESGTPAMGFREALQVAQDIYKNAGQLPDANAGEDEFASGFATGPKMPEGPAKRFA